MITKDLTTTPMTNPFFLTTAATIMMVNMATTVNGQDSPDYLSSVFRTTAAMSIELVQFRTEPAAVVASNSVGYETREVHHIEEASSAYFWDLLIHDESTLRFIDHPKDDIVDVAVTVTDQTTTTLVVDTTATDTDNRSVVVKFDAEVALLHVDDVGSDGVTDLASLLAFLIGRNNTGASYPYLENIINTGTTTVSEIRSLSFTPTEPSIEINNITISESFQAQNTSSGGRTGSEKTLIVFVTLLSIALVVVSSVLCWIGGGWLELRKQVEILMRREEELTRMTIQQNHLDEQHDDLKTKPTDDTEEDGDNSPARETHFTNASGFLGANNPYHTSSRALEGLGIKMTPARDRNSGDDGDDLATPMSTYSDSGRAPIGIMSMRKLMPGSASLGGGAESDDESNSDDDKELEGPSSLPPEMKQLQF
jgi:hypothetical protein